MVKSSHLLSNRNHNLSARKEDFLYREILCLLFSFGTSRLLALYRWARHPKSEFLHLTNEDLLSKGNNEHQALNLGSGTQTCSRRVIITTLIINNVH